MAWSAPGSFGLTDPPRRLSFRGRPVALDARSLEILAVLAERPGDTVTEAELVERLAAGAPIDESQLFDSVAAINKVLGDCIPVGCYVAHFPHEGFVLVVPEPPAAQRAQHLPARLTSIVGRADAIAGVAAMLGQHRFVTIVGPGGIGKTTVAVAVAQALAESFEDGVCFVELAPLVDGALIPGTVAAAVGAPLQAEDPLDSLARWLRDKRMLIILDSCEHVVEMAAHVAQAILCSGAHAAVLATSREPLRARGERVRHLPAMRIPADESGLSAAEALDYSAIELFVERARAAAAGFELQDADAALLASLCRRLDGIPLAIEIAAARVAELGIRGLASQVERRLLELPAMRRTTPPRHRTLAALLDWSYELLSDEEKQLLQRLSVFRNSFTLESATAVADGGEFEPAAVSEGLRDLVAKSLVASTLVDRDARFRLLDTTREYAARKLERSGSRAGVCRRHAEHLLAVLGCAELDWERMSQPDWVARYARWIDDVRSALEWSFAPGGDAQIGIALTLASFALARQMCLDAEFNAHLDRALEVQAKLVPRPPTPDVPAGEPPDLEHARELRLIAALETGGPFDNPAVAARHRVAILTGLWGTAASHADFRAAARWAARIGGIARQTCDPVFALIAGRMRAQSLHYMGHHRVARSIAERIIANAPQRIPLAYNPSPIELRISMRIVLARILWLQGFAEQAASMAGECVQHARTGSPLAQFQALAMAAIPIALWTGGGAPLDEWVAELHANATRHALGPWRQWAVGYRELLALRRGEAETAPAPGDDQQDLGEPDPNVHDHLCTFEARFLTAADIQRLSSGRVGWCAPEILRLQGEHILKQTADAASSGEDVLWRSFALARRQGALAWQLRTAISLARLRRAQGRRPEALDLLDRVHAQFTEGFDTADGRAAGALLADLRM